MVESIDAVCPECSGKKQFFAFVNTGVDYKKHYSRMVDCFLCKGTGTVTHAVIAQVVAGKALRKERLARSETLSQAAQRLGVSPAKLSAIENGRETM